MNDLSFHFNHPWWLLGLLAIPVVLFWLKHTAPSVHEGRERLYADPDLLPLLTGHARLTQQNSGASARKLWSLAWMLLVIAMSEPRYDFHLATVFEPSADLVMVLDISNSMLIQDQQPSRLERAKQEIQDLLEQGQGLRFGLVAFASVAHVVSPLTEDAQGIVHQLPSLSPHLLRLQGSRLTDALRRAQTLLLTAGSDRSQHILLLSDGEFADADLKPVIDELNQANIQLHTLGFGTPGGGPVVVNGTPAVGPDGTAIISRFDETELRQLAAQAQGIYQPAEYSDQDSRNLLALIRDSAVFREKGSERTKLWRDYSPWLLIPAAILLLALYGFVGRRKP